MFCANFVVDVAERRQLFCDDMLLNVHATTATRYAATIDGGDDPIIILRPDERWEQGKTLDHASVLYDPVDKKVKLYYSLAVNCGVTCDQNTDEEDGMLGYAESVDGIHFSKPKLGLVNDTNLLGPNVAGPSVFLNSNPAAAADERFVSVGKCHGSSSMCPNAWAWMTSADGLHWPHIHHPSTCGMKKSVDTQYTTFFDPSADAFLSYTRDRYGQPPELRAIRRVRRVSASTLGTPGQAYTDADCPWTNSTVVIDIDARDNSTHPRAAQTNSYNKVFPPMDLYGAVVWPDFGAGVYWAFPWRFWHFEKGAAPGTYDVALMSSRDGLHFSYANDRKPFVRTGREGTAGSSRVRVLPSPVVLNDTMLVYLYLTNLAEMKGKWGDYNETTDNRPIQSALGVVRMRRDGFVGLASPTYGKEALVTTVVLLVSGGGDLWVTSSAHNCSLRAARTLILKNMSENLI
eukprot:SAG31_NODE_8257_length_1487_cov_3.510086_1_plen_459_part_10